MVYPTERLAFLACTQLQSRWEQLGDSPSNGQQEVSTSPPLELDIASSSPLESPRTTHLPSGSPTFLSTFPRDDIAQLVHCKGSFFPPVCPCDWANGSNTKTHWTSKELHQALGCCRFQNCKHILQTSLVGQWINGGKFWLALRSFAIIPMSNRGGTIDCANSCFLDIIHMDIAFDDCVLVVFFCYALILVDCATRYNWLYGLKDLSEDSILLALHYFKVKAGAGSYACCFRLDCNTKLFGTCIREHLIDNNSNIVATAAGCQLANRLAELHWKTMVHMSHAYITEKQMLCSFWFFLVVHSAQMINAIPEKLHRKLAYPFLLVHGVGHDKCNCFPLFLVCYFITTETGMWHVYTPRHTH
jgi:hypothetical protein